jgi:hypothetical protein
LKRLIIMILTLCLITATSVIGQEMKDLVKPVMPSVYNVEVGTHLYYTPNRTFIVRGYDFSYVRKWDSDIYYVAHLPMLDITYTNMPGKLLTTDVASLFHEAHRFDLELKIPMAPFKPLVSLEVSTMDLYVPKLIKVQKPEVTNLIDGKTVDIKAVKMIEETQLITERDTINRLYGGIGMSAEFPMNKAVSVKGAAAWKCLNQSGWEAAMGVDLKLPNILQMQPHVLVGGNIHEIKYNWGESKGYSFLAEIGFTF